MKEIADRKAMTSTKRVDPIDQHFRDLIEPGQMAEAQDFIHQRVFPLLAEAYQALKDNGYNAVLACSLPDENPQECGLRMGNRFELKFWAFAMKSDLFNAVDIDRSRNPFCVEHYPQRYISVDELRTFIHDWVVNSVETLD